MFISAPGAAKNTGSRSKTSIKRSGDKRKLPLCLKKKAPAEAGRFHYLRQATAETNKKKIRVSGFLSPPRSHSHPSPS